MDSSMTENSNYCISDKNGFVIEKSESFNTSDNGYATDIAHNVRRIVNSNSTVNTIDIFFENSTVVIKDNSSTNLHMTMIIENKHK